MEGQASFIKNLQYSLGIWLSDTTFPYHVWSHGFKLQQENQNKTEQN